MAHSVGLRVLLPWTRITREFKVAVKYAEMNGSQPPTLHCALDWNV